MGKPEAGVEEALEELYQASPERFTAARDALAKKLKTAGDAEGAAAVRSRRKPTQLAYVLNQLSRRHAEELGGLVDVGRELARAQRKALRGEAGSELREAIGRQRDVVRALTRTTGDLMRELGVSPAGHLDEIASALQAALVDPAVGALLEQGRLEKVPALAAGFPGAAARGEGDAGAAPAPPKRERGPEQERGPEPERGRAAAARAKQEAARAEAAERAGLAERAEQEAEEQTATARALAAKVSALTAKATDLEAEARRVADEARRVKKEAVTTQRSATTAAARAERATVAAKRARGEATRAAARARAR